MMKEHEIKEVCKFMGYEYVHYLHVKDERGDWVVDGRMYDPSDDHKQFAEVWNKLSYEQKKEVLINTLLPKPKVSVWITDIVLNDLPAVMSAVMTVIREK